MVQQKTTETGNLLSSELSLIISISLIVFLFFLFFQPITAERFDFNNNLIFLSGYGGIIFLIMLFFRILLPLIVTGKSSDRRNINSSLSFSLMIVSCSVAFAFYTYYVGGIGTTFHNTLQLSLISVISIVVLWQNDIFSKLKQRIETLISEKKQLQKELENFNTDDLHQTVVLTSDNLAEKVQIPITDLAFIKSADNYVEVIFRNQDKFSKSLLRNTLKNTEYQLQSHASFIRCHRTHIVNMHFVEKLTRKFSNHLIIIRDFDEPIPVSRQYLLKIKEALQ